MDNSLLYSPYKKIYARISLLTKDEQVVTSVEGITTGGSINVDGKSAVRRTCNLSLAAAADSPFVKDDWTLNSKFELSIGVSISDDANITWYPMGIYLITSFSSSLSTTSLTISIQGKDKMGLLDGSIGGQLAAAHDFGTIDIIEQNGDIKNESLPIKEIIMEAVHTYANEPYQNIIIKDIPDHGLELESFRGDEPMYLLLQEDEGDIKIINIILDNNFLVYTENGTKKISELDNYYFLGVEE